MMMALVFWSGAENDVGIFRFPILTTRTSGLQKVTTEQVLKSIFADQKGIVFSLVHA